MPGSNILLLPGVGLLRSLNPPLSKKDKDNVEQIVKFLSFLQGRGGGADIGVRGSINQLAPVVNEFRRETRDFVIQLILRLSEMRVARGLKYLGGANGGGRSRERIA